MYEQVDKPKENKSRAVANSVTQKKSDVKQGFGFVDNRSDATSKRKMKETVNDSLKSIQLKVGEVTGSLGKTNIPSISYGRLSTTVLQRQILIGDKWEGHADDVLVSDIEKDVKPRLNSWSELKDNIFKKGTNGDTNKAVNAYYTVDLSIGVSPFEADIRASLRKHNNRTSFADRSDLYRQVTQDIKLSLLGFHNIAGIAHHDGQFKRTDDGFGGSASGRKKKLVIYRTMPKADWSNYKGSGDLKDILFGHGGSLGQAMHYFDKSKKSSKDDVLVEFKFSGDASKLLDYSKVNGGGEGGAPQGNKLTGKSEQNDIMKVDKDVFSVHLHKSKDLIKELKPQVRLVEKVL
ncbi:MULTISPECIES: hypothetical protein [unclassified Pseudoalteromonas]|uniref:hypothetical protein n=1 Tax=unclassified Pseudoalteromonas TaxID=194690 RepID=UPI000BBF2870|nr:hypothetical protein [Pseudoalteromonas sp. 1_2015MBL_MicDiv]ATG76431.1 hypothetical protein AOR04_02115 [Pseudoalteromonas sp. 1_2015MBL_MicDiv]